MRLAEEDRYQNCGLDFISLRSIDQLYANRFGWRFLLSPLAPRLTFFTHRSFQGSALERPVPLALPSTPSASRLTFSTRNVCNATFKWSRNRDYQTSGCGTVRPLNSGEPSYDGLQCRLSLRERSVTLDRLSQSVWPSINGSLLDWHFITAPADGARRPAGSTVATFYGLRPRESLLLRRSTLKSNLRPVQVFDHLLKCLAEPCGNGQSISCDGVC